MRLQGKRNRGKEEVKFLEIKGDDQLSGNQQWMTKKMSEEKQQRQSFSKVMTQLVFLFVFFEFFSHIDHGTPTCICFFFCHGSTMFFSPSSENTVAFLPFHSMTFDSAETRGAAHWTAAAQASDHISNSPGKRFHEERTFLTSSSALISRLRG